MSVTTAGSALAHDLRVGVMRLARRLRTERPDSLLTLTQLATLATLERHGPVTPGELAAYERVQPPSMTRVIARLDSLGLLERVPHATDRRQAVVSISSAGRALLREDRRRREAWLARRLEELTPAERDLLRAAVPVLDRLASA